MCFSTRRRNSWKAGLWKVWHAINVQRVPGCEDFLNLTEESIQICVQQIVIHSFAKSSLTRSLATCSLEIVLTWLCYYVVIVWLSAGLFLLSLFWTTSPPPTKLEYLCRLNMFFFFFFHQAANFDHYENFIVWKPVIKKKQSFRVQDIFWGWKIRTACFCTEP